MSVECGRRRMEEESERRKTVGALMDLLPCNNSFDSLQTAVQPQDGAALDWDFFTPLDDNQYEMDERRLESHEYCQNVDSYTSSPECAELSADSDDRQRTTSEMSSISTDIDETSTTSDSQSQDGDGELLLTEEEEKMRREKMLKEKVHEVVKFEFDEEDTVMNDEEQEDSGFVPFGIVNSVLGAQQAVSTLTSMKLSQEGKILNGLCIAGIIGGSFATLNSNNTTLTGVKSLSLLVAMANYVGHAFFRQEGNLAIHEELESERCKSLKQDQPFERHILCQDVKERS